MEEFNLFGETILNTDVGERPESRELNREEVIGAFEKSRTAFEEAAKPLKENWRSNPDSLNPQEKDTLDDYQTVQSALQERDENYQIAVRVKDTDEKEIQIKEGVPVEGVIAFLEREVERLGQSKDQQEIQKKDEYLEHLDTLKKHSRPLDARHRTIFKNKPKSREERVRFEAKVRSEDEVRRSTNPDDNDRMTEDWQRAEDALKRRRELVLPKVKKTSIVIPSGKANDVLTELAGEKREAVAHKIPFWGDRFSQGPIKIETYQKASANATFSEAQLKASGINPDSPPDYILHLVRQPDGRYSAEVNLFEAQQQWLEQVLSAVKSDRPQQTKESPQAYRQRLLQEIHDKLQWEGDYAEDPLRKKIATVPNPADQLFPHSLTGDTLMTIETMIKSEQKQAILERNRRRIEGFRAKFKIEPTVAARERVVHRGEVVSEEGDFQKMFERTGVNEEVRKDMLAADLVIDYLSGLKPNAVVLNETLKEFGVQIKEGQTYGEVKKDLAERIGKAPRGSQERIEAKKAYNQFRLHFYSLIHDALAPKGTLTAQSVLGKEIIDKLAQFDLQKSIVSYQGGRKKDVFSDLEATSFQDRALKGIEMYTRLVKEPVELESTEGLDNIYWKEFIQTEGAAEEYLAVDKTPPSEKALLPAAPSVVPEEPGKKPGKRIVQTDATNAAENDLRETTTPAEFNGPPVAPVVEKGQIPVREVLTSAPPKETREDEPPQEVTPSALANEMAFAVVTAPEKVEQEIGGLAQHDRAREKPARGFFKGLLTPIIAPREFFRNFWQNAIFADTFRARSISFARSMTEIARKHAGIDSSIFFKLAPEILDQAVEKGREMRKKENPFKRLWYTVKDVGSGLTGLYQNSDMIYARKWFEQNGEPLMVEAKTASLKDQTDLAERFAIAGRNEDVISQEVGEQRYLLDELIPDQAVRDGLQVKIKELVGQYAQGQKTIEEVLKEFNLYYHREILPKIPEIQRKKLEGIEVASTIKKVAEEMLIKDQGTDKTRYERYEEEVGENGKKKWDELQFKIYVGRAKYAPERGEVKLSRLERKLIRRMMEQDYKFSHGLVLNSAVETAKDFLIYGGAYAAGALGAAKFLGQKLGLSALTLNPVGGMIGVSVMAGAREGVVFSRKGKLYGLRGKAITDFEQVSRETAGGRVSMAEARLRPKFEQAMVDQRLASELIQPIVSLLQKESLDPNEQKQLMIAVAHAKARLKLTDLSTQKGKEFLGLGQLSVTQNFIQCSGNEEKTALHAAIVQGVVKLSQANPQLVSQLSQAQRVMEAQLKVGSFKEKIANQVSQGLKISRAEADTLIDEYFAGLGDLGIDTKAGKSLEKATATLAKVVDKRAFTTTAFAMVAAPIIGAEMKLVSVPLAEIGSFIREGGAHWQDWQQVIRGDVPVEIIGGRVVSDLTPLQQGALMLRNMIEPPPDIMGVHQQVIDGVHFTLGGSMRYKVDGNNDYLVDIRNGKIYDLTQFRLEAAGHGQLNVFATSDLNGDGQIDLADNLLAKNQFNQTMAQAGMKIAVGPDIVTKSTVDILKSSGSQTVTVEGHQATIPAGTHFQLDKASGKHDLVLDSDPSKVLINDASFDSSGHMTAVSIDPALKYSEAGGAEIVLKGPEAVAEWQKHGTNIDHREWYSYDKPGSQENELRLYVRHEGDDLIIDVSKMKEGYQTGLSPDHVNVQEVVHSGRGVLAWSLPGHTREPILVEMPKTGEFHLNFSDTTHHVNILNADGSLKETMTVADFTRTMINKPVMDSLPQGNIVTELGHQNVFNLGSGGQMGFAEAGRIDPDTSGVFQAFATIRGASDAQFITSGGLTPILELTSKITETVTTSTPTFTLISPPLEMPVIPFVPTPMRQNIEKSIRGEAKPEAPAEGQPAKIVTQPSDQGVLPQIQVPPPATEEERQKLEEERDQLAAKVKELTDKKESGEEFSDDEEEELKEKKERLAELEAALQLPEEEGERQKLEQRRDELLREMEGLQKEIETDETSGKDATDKKERCRQLEEEKAELEARFKAVEEEDKEAFYRQTKERLNEFIQEKSPAEIVRAYSYFGIDNEEKAKELKEDGQKRNEFIKHYFATQEAINEVVNRAIKQINDEEMKQLLEKAKKKLSDEEREAITFFEPLIQAVDNIYEQALKEKRELNETDARKIEEEKAKTNLSEEEFNQKMIAYQRALTKLNGLITILVLEKPEVKKAVEGRATQIKTQIEDWEAEVGLPAEAFAEAGIGVPPTHEVIKQPIEENVIYRKKARIIPDLHGSIEIQTGSTVRAHRVRTGLTDFLTNLQENELFVSAGDIFDRGPYSCEAAEKMMEMVKNGQALWNFGNHEFLFMAAMKGDLSAFLTWFGNGGDDMMKSVGIDVEQFGTDFQKLHQAASTNQELIRLNEFLQQHGKTYTIIDTIFVTHAGLLVDSSTGDFLPVVINEVNFGTGVEAMDKIQEEMRKGNREVIIWLANHGGDDKSNAENPFWVRETYFNALQNPVIAHKIRENLNKQLAKKGTVANLIVTGHTTQYGGRQFPTIPLATREEPIRFLFFDEAYYKKGEPRIVQLVVPNDKPDNVVVFYLNPKTKERVADPTDPSKKLEFAYPMDRKIENH